MALAATCADNQLALSSPQIQFANADLITGFYSELAENISRSVDWEHDLEVDPQTGESTVNIKTSPSTDRVRVNSDERFRALFGNDAFNLRLLESAKEQMLPSAGN